MKKDVILSHLQNKRIVILGFGKEGVSSYHFIRKYFPTMPLTVADKSTKLQVADFQGDTNLTFVLGDAYNQNLNDFDLIIKTPGINLNNLNYFIPRQKLTSQTELFLQAFSDQIVGVTGTKGKSTTASLIFHILQNATGKAILSGNIGIPFFDIIDQITDETTVVAELSAHQLEFVDAAPHIAILLNIYQEHLDHFNSFSNYQLAKFNITEHQKEDDFLIYNADNQQISLLIAAHDLQRNYLPFSRQKVLHDGAYSFESQVVLAKHKEKIAAFDLNGLTNLPGTHNYNNIMAAILACKLKNVSDEAIFEHLKSFKGLPHRLEFVGKFDEILFYNDSISTIPETCIAALKTLRKVDTLVLGGYDRGIDYQILIDFLQENPVNNIAFTGPAGKRIFDEWKAQFALPSNFILENDFDEIVLFAFQKTEKGKICLLSPAASSYDQFKNFVERGDAFKAAVEERAATNR